MPSRFNAAASTRVSCAMGRSAAHAPSKSRAAIRSAARDSASSCPAAGKEASAKNVPRQIQRPTSKVYAESELNISRRIDRTCDQSEIRIVRRLVTCRENMPVEGIQKLRLELKHD